MVGDGLCHSGMQALLCVAWVYVGVEKLMQRGIMVVNITYLVLGGIVAGVGGIPVVKGPEAAA